MLKIRLLNGQDALFYRDLRLKALQTDPKSFLSTYQAEKNNLDSFFARELDLAIFPPVFAYWGVFENKQLIAYVQLAKSYLAKQAHLAFIYNLYLDPAFRKQGIASRLLKEVLAKLRTETKVERVFLSCNANNHNALQFYKKFAFKTCGVKEKSIKWQGEYDDQVEMVLELV
ncbi:MAG: GNAT family N-acetyltransferase [Candidatus Woesebacteria bacterium]|jgi:ribosomal protein S18 acetylase RimI-like enzyme